MSVQAEDGQYIGPVYTQIEDKLAADDITDLINSLTPSQQDAVREFVLFLQERGQTPASPFLAAVDEFINGHPELLRRLAL